MRLYSHAGCFGWVFRVFARKHLPVWGDNFLAADARLFDVVIARGSIAGMDFPAGVVIRRAQPCTLYKRPLFSSSISYCSI